MVCKIVGVLVNDTKLIHSFGYWFGISVVLGFIGISSYQAREAFAINIDIPSWMKSFNSLMSRIII